MQHYSLNPGLAWHSLRGCLGTKANRYSYSSIESHRNTSLIGVLVSQLMCCCLHVNWQGDIGRYMLNGEIEILGRSDGQVKVGGNRVELAQIEQCIAQFGVVRRAAAVLAAEPYETLVAFVVLGDGLPLDRVEDQLRVQVKDHICYLLAMII